jgi:hypothetical protein
VHGYEKQLNFYRAASQTEYAVFVVVDYGDGAEKLNVIRKMRERRVTDGERASDIIIIDATPKASASKRK